MRSVREDETASVSLLFFDHNFKIICLTDNDAALVNEWRTNIGIYSRK